MEKKPGCTSIVGALFILVIAVAIIWGAIFPDNKNDGVSETGVKSAMITVTEITVEKYFHQKANISLWNSTVDIIGTGLRRKLECDNLTIGDTVRSQVVIVVEFEDYTYNSYRVVSLSINKVHYL